MKTQPPYKLYNLVYYGSVNRRKISTEMWNKPITLVKWKKRVLENTTHRNGVLKIEENKTRAMKPRGILTH